MLQPEFLKKQLRVLMVSSIPLVSSAYQDTHIVFLFLIELELYRQPTSFLKGVLE